MSKPEWSPGPWSMSITDDTVIVDKDHDEIATVYFDYDELYERYDATARLISAAPDMYEALRLYLEYEKLPADRGGKNGPKGRAWTAFVVARDSAMAKARGETEDER